MDRPRARIRAFFALFAGFRCEPHSLDGITLIEIPSNGHGIDTAGKRCLLFPRKFYEFDAAGKPVHYSPYNGQVCDGYLYTDTGFWDTFRALFLLLNFVYPSVNQEIQVGLANIAAENDFLHEWASPGHRGYMVGNNSASVVADAIVKGVTPQDKWEALYDRLVHASDCKEARPSSGRA